MCIPLCILVKKNLASTEDMFSRLNPIVHWKKNPVVFTVNTGNWLPANLP